MQEEKEIFAVLKLDGDTHQLQAGGYIIGRNSFEYLHDIPIDHETVDVKHAVLDVRMYGAKIMDVCSKTGTCVDGKVIEKMNFVDLFGSAKLTFGVVSAEILIVNQIASDLLGFNSSKNVSDIVPESPNITTKKREHALPISRMNNKLKKSNQNIAKKSWGEQDKFTSDIIVESTQKVRGDDIFANISDENIKKNIEELEEVDDYYVPETQEIFERKSYAMKESQNFIMIPSEEFDSEDDGKITSQNLLKDTDKSLLISPLEELKSMRHPKEEFCDSDLDEEMSALEWTETAKFSINEKIPENQKSGSVTPDIDFQSTERSRELSVTPDLQIDSGLHNKSRSVTPDLDFDNLPTQIFHRDPKDIVVFNKKEKKLTVPKEAIPPQLPTDFDDLPTQIFHRDPKDSVVFKKKEKNLTVPKEAIPPQLPTDFDDLPTQIFHRDPKDSVVFMKKENVTVPKEAIPAQLPTDYDDLPTQVFVLPENFNLRQCVSHKKDINSTHRQKVSSKRKSAESPNTEEKTYNNSNTSSVKLIAFPVIKTVSKKEYSSEHDTNRSSSFKASSESNLESKIFLDKSIENNKTICKKSDQYVNVTSLKDKKQESFATVLESDDEEDKSKRCDKAIATSDESSNKRRKHVSVNKLFGSSSEDEGDLSPKRVKEKSVHSFRGEKSNSHKRSNEYKKLPDIKKHHKETLNLNYTNSVINKRSNVSSKINLNIEKCMLSEEKTKCNKIHKANEIKSNPLEIDSSFKDKVLVKINDKCLATNTTTAIRSSHGKTEQKLSKDAKNEKREIRSSESSSTARVDKKKDINTKSKILITPTECFSYRTRSQKRANSRSEDDYSTENKLQEQETGKRSSSRTSSKEDIFEVDIFRKTTKIKLTRCDTIKENSRNKSNRSRKIKS